MSIQRILNSQTKTTFAAASLLGITMLASRIFGLVRDRILAGKYGASDELDMYYAAFQIPDFLYMVLILGAVATAFLPIFTEYFHRNEKEAWKLANQVLNLFLFSLIAGGMALALFAPWFVRLIAPGFEGEKYEMTVRLTQIMFLSPVIFGISNVMGVILQFFRRFFIYSIAPIFYNIGIIIGALFFTPLWGVYGLAYGVILGALMHMMIQIPVAIWCGFRFRPTLSFFSEGVRKIIWMMLPRSFGLTVSHISFIIFTAIASLVSSGAITVFHFANNLQYLPISILGVSFAVASFPLLSRLYVEKQEELFLKEFFKAFRTVVFFAIPAAVLFFVLRAHIVRVILGTGNFGWDDTRLTAGALGIFAIGIPFLCLIPLCTRAFFARQNTKTPVMLNTVGTILGVFIAMGILFWLRQDGSIQHSIFAFLDIEDVPSREIIALPLGISIGALINFFALSFALLKDRGIAFWRSIFFLLQVSLIAAISGFIGWISLQATSSFLDPATFMGIFIHGAVGGITTLVAYIIFASLLRIEEMRDVRSFFRLRKWIGYHVQKNNNVLE